MREALEQSVRIVNVMTHKMAGRLVIVTIRGCCLVVVIALNCFIVVMIVRIWP